MVPHLRVVLLTEASPALQKEGAARLLSGARAALVRPREHLETIEERLVEVSPGHRYLFVGLNPETDEVAGLVDLTVHCPAPMTATVGAIVVAQGLRGHGVGGVLLRDALNALPPEERPEALAAGVHADNAAALAFFLALGLTEEGTEGGVIGLRG